MNDIDPFWIGAFFLAVGLFSVFGAALNWSLFVNHRKARGLATLIGQTGMRIFYVLLGVALVVLGVLFMTGVVKN